MIVRAIAFAGLALTAGCLDSGTFDETRSTDQELDVQTSLLEDEAAAPPRPLLEQTFVNKVSDLCAAIGGGAIEGGARAIQWHCNYGWEQEWHMFPHHLPGIGVAWEIVNHQSGKALAVGSGSRAPGADVIQWYRNDGREQRWFWRKVGGFDVFENVNSNQCLSVASGSTAPATKLIQWYCNDFVRENQKWDVFHNPD